MDNGFKQWLLEKINETKKIEHALASKKREEEIFIREQVIPEAVDFLKNVKSMLENEGFKTTLTSGPDWFEFKLFYKDEDYIGLGIQLELKKRKFQLVYLFKEENKEGVSVIDEEITKENWSFSGFKQNVQRYMNNYFIRYPIKF